MIVEPDFLDHWKTQFLRDRLGGDAAIMVILRLWAHCQFRKTNRFTMSTEAWKSVCRWPGDPEQLLSALLDAGFLDRTDEQGTYTVHDWEKTNAYLMQAWENGAKGGRPRISDKPKKPGDNRPETDRKPTGFRPETDPKPDGNPRQTVRQSIDEIDREDRGEGEKHDLQFFPEDSIPFLVAQYLRDNCQDLAGFRADDVARGAFAVSVHQQMPREEWLRAAQEMAATINTGGGIHPKGPAVMLKTYIATRHREWSRDQAHAKKFAPGEADDSAWSSAATRSLPTSDAPSDLAAATLARRLQKRTPAPLPSPATSAP